MNLVYKNENSLKFISIAVSVLVWSGILVITKGLVLFYVLLFGVFYLFAQSGFVAHLRGTGVKVSEQQYPDIHAQLIAACRKLDLSPVPECYVLRTNTFNALATRFLGCSFIVLFSDVVDALRDHPDALAFYIGHEVGHLKRRHIQWQPFLMPAAFLPLLGAGYHRAKEYTCDRHGLACSPSLPAAETGLVALATGRTRIAATNVPELIAQTAATRSFWMSFHELIADYPWLTKRIAEINAVGNGITSEQPRRNPFAWLLAVFVPRIGVGGASSMLVTVAMIGILAAIAIPAYQEYTIRAQVTEGLNLASPYKAAVARAAASNPDTITSLDNDAVHLGSVVRGTYVGAITVESGAIVIHYGNRSHVSLAGQQLVLVPAVNSAGQLMWICGRGHPPNGFTAVIEDYSEYTTVPDKVLPTACRSAS